MADTPIVDVPQPVPSDARNTWREAWGFFASSQDRRVDSLVHISTEPGRGEGVFTFVVWIDGRRHKHIERAPVPADPNGARAIATDHLAFDLTDPGSRCRVSYRNADVELDLEYTTRLHAHRFSSSDADALYPVENEELPVEVRGEVRMAGVHGPIAFDGFGVRDHSWGRWPEMPFRRHEWVAVNFGDRFVQFSRTEARESAGLRIGGFWATAHGKGVLSSVACDDAYWVDPAEHLPPLDRDVEVSAVRADGGVDRVRLELSQAHARHHMNRRDPGRDRMYEQVTLFCSAVALDTGHEGWAGVEVGKLLERPGVCDEAIPRGTDPTHVSVAR